MVAITAAATTVVITTAAVGMEQAGTWSVAVADMWSAAAADTGTSLVTMVITTAAIMAGMQAMLTTRAIGMGDAK